MKNILFLIICAVSFSLGFISCSNEDISPSYADQNLFEPSSEDHSANAELQRNFYKETGSYLLFNDTLKKVQNGALKRRRIQTLFLEEILWMILCLYLTW